MSARPSAPDDRGDDLPPGWEVEEALFAHAGSFDFHQAVRLLEAMFGGTPGVGERANPGREAVRFRGDVGLAFPPAEVVEIRPPEHGSGEARPAEMTVAFLSLAGAHGPLPMPLTERVLERMAEGDAAGRDFLDLFHHRLVSLAWRIARRSKPVLQGVLPARTETAEVLRALVGLGTPGLADRLPGVDDRALLARAGLLANRVRSEAGLRGLLADHFGVSVTVEPLVGKWLSISPGEWTRIGRAGANRALGVDTALGRRAWDPQAAIRVRLEGLPLALYLALLPGGPTTAEPAEGRALAELRELVRFYAGVETDFVLALVLRAEEAPETRLTRAAPPQGARLGWTSWLRTRPLEGDPEVRIDPARACGCAAPS